jgi:hypothetical protein
MHVSKSLRRRFIAGALIAASLVGAGAGTAAAAPKLSKKQAHAFKLTCRYFSTDYTALVGIQAMSNLTGAELRSAFRYVASDIAGAEPVVSRPDRKQLKLAVKLLGQFGASTPSGRVSEAEKRRLSKSFKSAPFSTLNSTLKAACGHG